MMLNIAIARTSDATGPNSGTVALFGAVYGGPSGIPV